MTSHNPFPTSGVVIPNRPQPSNRGSRQARVRLAGVGLRGEDVRGICFSQPANQTTKTLLLTILSLLALTLLLAPPASAQYTISTIAGGGPNGLAALNSSIGYPASVVIDGLGNTYIADSWSSRILEVSAAGTVTIVAGNGSSGYSGDGGPATSASLDTPLGVAVDSSGNIFIADTGNALIREVTASNGTIQTVAGSASLGAGYSGDGGPATSSQLNFPAGIYLDSFGDIFIADAVNSAIREVVASTGNIQTVAGTPTVDCADPTTACGDNAPATSAQLDLPEGVFVDANGIIYIADTYTARVRVVNTTAAAITVATVTIAPGNIATIAGAYYQTNGGTSCAAYVNPNPPNPALPALSAQLCAPTGVSADSAGDIFINDSYNSVVDEIPASSANLTTVAGNGTAGFSGDTGLATAAQLNTPNNIFLDSTGDIYIADTNNFVIREVAASTSDINTVVGNNTQGDSGDGGLATNAQINIPEGLFLDSTGDIFIADSFNSVVREVVAASGNIQTVAGNPKTPCTVGSANYPACGDAGAALTAQFNSPSSIAVDAAGDIYIADPFINRIRIVTASTGNVTNFAGSPSNTACVPASYSTCGDGGAATSATLFQPFAVALDSTGNLFIADTDDHTIRVVNNGTAALVLAGVTIAPGAIATIAGNATQCSSASAPCGDGGASTSANLNFPNSVFVDSSENVYIADSGDNRIRVVNTSAASTTIATVTVPAGAIATVAGTGLEGYSGDGAAALSATLSSPSGLFVDSSGNIYVSDTANYVTREVVASTGFIGTIAGNNTQGFSGDTGSSTSAQINAAYAVFGDTSSNIYIADTDNSRIRKLTPNSSSQATAAPPASQTVSAGGTADFAIQLTAHTGDPRYAITLSCASSSLPTNATCSFSPSQVTPGPAPVPFTLTVTVPAASAALINPGGHQLPFFFAIAPLAGILFTGALTRTNRRGRYLLLGVLATGLILLNACGGGSNSGSGGSGTTYTIQVQGTTAAQTTPFTITTASLTVQ